MPEARGMCRARGPEAGARQSSVVSRALCSVGVGDQVSQTRVAAPLALGLGKVSLRGRLASRTRDFELNVETGKFRGVVRCPWTWFRLFELGEF